MRKIWKTLAFGAGLVASAAALPQASQAQDAVRIIAVTHGQASDPFWSIVKNGMAKAAEEAGVSLDYRAPETFDMVQMAQLIDAAVNQRPAGLIVSNPDPDALGPAIEKAVAAGIPVISVNSGVDAVSRLGIKLHVGQEERAAGKAAGERLAELGATNILCINHEVGNASLDQRCEGLAEGFTAGKTTVLPTTADPSEVEAKIQAALSSDTTVDGILTLSAPLAGEPAVNVVERTGLRERVKIGTFDMSPGFLQAVEAGKADFAIDQQPYLQGYLPVSFLALNARDGLMPAGNVPSGPSFVTQETAAQVVDGASKGIR